MMEHAMEYAVKHPGTGTRPDYAPPCIGMPKGRGIFRATIPPPCADGSART